MTMNSLTPANAVSSDIALTTEDAERVKALAATIDIRNPLSITSFGQDVAQHVARCTDGLLAKVSGSNLNIIGDKLTKVLDTAHGINANQRFAGIPVVGRALAKLTRFKDRLLTSVQSAGGQIDEMLGQVDEVRQRLDSEVIELEEMYGGVREEYRLLGVHIEAAKLKCDELRELIADMSRGEQTPESAQEISDLNNTLNHLEKRVADLAVLQESALLTMPAIRLVQSNNARLIEKYQTIKTVTVPAWRRQIALAISLDEQRQAVELADSIDDTTNALLKRNADLLHSNAVGSAKSNQRLAIDIKTLEYVQQQLIDTVTEVMQIEKAGATARRETESKLVSMRDSLTQRLLAGPKGKEAA